MTAGRRAANSRRVRQSRRRCTTAWSPRRTARSCTEGWRCGSSWPPPRCSGRRASLTARRHPARLGSRGHRNRVAVSTFMLALATVPRVEGRPHAADRPAGRESRRDSRADAAGMVRATGHAGAAESGCEPDPAGLGCAGGIGDRPFRGAPRSSRVPTPIWCRSPSGS